MEKLISDLSIGVFFWQSLIFIVLIFLLRKFAWKPILDAVNTREESIVNALNAAENAKEEMAKLTSQNEALRKEALAERDALMKEARDAKDKIVSEAKAKAVIEADRIMAIANEAIKNEKLAAITEIKNQVATLSIEIAEKIIKKELASDDKQKVLVDNLVEEVNLN